MTDADIVKWLVREGDMVSKDDKMVEVETAKVDVELQAPVSGVVRKIVAPAGGNAKVGDVIALIGEPDEPIVEEFR